jgi:hypothetical protein
VQTIRDFWCRLTHNDPTWPIRGKYYCRRCWSVRDVPWANTVPVEGRAVFAAPASELGLKSSLAPWNGGATPIAELRIPGAHWQRNSGS